MPKVSPRPATQFQVAPNCKACELHEGCKYRGMRDRNCDGHRPLLIFTDFPDYYAEHAGRPYALHSGRILDWVLARMSIDPSLVGYAYTLKCHATKTIPSTKAGRSACIVECNQYRFATIAKTRPRSLVSLGDATLEAFTGRSKSGGYAGRNVRVWEGAVSRYVQHIWIGYSLQYILFGAPSETVGTYRTIWRAAEEAGLNPKTNLNVPNFKWPDLM